MPKNHKKAMSGLFLLFLYRMFYFFMLAVILGISAQALIPSINFHGFLIFFLLVFGTCITIHEVGHLWGAVIGKFRVTMFSVGLLKFVRSRNRWYIRYNRFFLLGGFTLASPLKDENLDRRLVVWTLGGPLTGIFYAIASWTILLILNSKSFLPFTNKTTDLFVVLQVWLLANAGFSFLISLHSLIPEQTWSSSSDGYKLLQYWRKGTDATAIKYLYLLSGAAQSGVRPRDWHEDYLDDLMDPSMPLNHRMHALLLSYLSEMDKGFIEQAGRSLDQALLLSRGEKLPSASLYWEAAYYNARFRNQPILARQWLSRAQKGFLDEEQTRARAEAAILIAEGQFEQAMIWIDKGLSVLDWSLEPGTAKAEQEWLISLRNLALESNRRTSLTPHRPMDGANDTTNVSVNGESQALVFEAPHKKTIALKDKIIQFFRIDHIVNSVFLRFTPVAIFCLILAFLYYWLVPPACSPKIIENLLCKSKYNLSIIEGLNAERQGRNEEALLAFSEAINVQPQGCLALSLRAHLTTFLGDYQLAFLDYSTLLDHCQDKPRYLLSRAGVLIKQGMYPSAIDDLTLSMNALDETAFIEGRSLLDQSFREIDDLDLYINAFHSENNGEDLASSELCKLGLAYAYRGNQAQAKEVMTWLLSNSQPGYSWCIDEIGRVSGINP